MCGQGRTKHYGSKSEEVTNRAAVRDKGKEN